MKFIFTPRNSIQIDSHGILNNSSFIRISKYKLNECLFSRKCIKLDL